jgi:divalent metal cation (Fe/Co/Zn/Cd) transporter
MPLGQAHAITDQLEQVLRSEIDGIARVEIHLEPREPQTLHGRVVSAQHPEMSRDIARIAEEHAPITACHEVAISQAPDGLHVVLHCEAPDDVPMEAVHDASLTVESDIHRRYRDVRTVTVHFEPQSEQPTA